MSGDDRQPGASLYDKLEHVSSPSSMNPAVYAKVMRSAIAVNGSFFNTQRMVSSISGMPISRTVQKTNIRQARCNLIEHPHSGRSMPDPLQGSSRQLVTATGDASQIPRGYFTLIPSGDEIELSATYVIAFTNVLAMKPGAHSCWANSIRCSDRPSALAEPVRFLRLRAGTEFRRWKIFFLSWPCFRRR